MALIKTVHQAPEYIDGGVLGRLERESTLVLLPDTLSPVGGRLTAGFRDGAQGLRVRAKEQGVTVELFLPEDSRPGTYSEHGADWILPLVLGVPAATVADLIAKEIQGRIDEWRERGLSRTPT